MKERTDTINFTVEHSGGTRVSEDSCKSLRYRKSNHICMRRKREGIMRRYLR